MGMANGARRQSVLKQLGVETLKVCGLKPLKLHLANIWSNLILDQLLVSFGCLGRDVNGCVVGVPIGEIIAHQDLGRVYANASIILRHAVGQFLLGLTLAASKCNVTTAPLIGHRVTADVELEAPRIS